ncbi:hypothetical protein GPECTOR_17g833 [Gonium pectorale]|uniref:Uncharacterized protein n=1 Tax=Gonium pectorale TaxID=33097 RepID=A0A150GK34_GONPE|nr:hypothetical protein GPECTOR_17g833 [Gonium pectorale]|eukprot:KXZ50196.1 hypothetical protein GPECTOR_17g833 [Gonium pectorale]
MDVIRPRHLVFEDLSGSLARNAPDKLAQQRSGASGQAESIHALKAQLKAIAGSLQDVHSSMQQRVDGHRKAALEQLEATGGRQALESHLKAQKATWKFIGQKEAFLERVKALRDCQELLQHDFSNDIAIADKAVQALKEEIRDRNAAISKVEQQLGGMIQQITRLYESSNATAGQLAMQLPRIDVELEEYTSGRQEPPEPTVDGLGEAELMQLICEEEARATQLEQQAALESANWAAEQAEYAALEARLSELREDVAAMEEECSEAAKKQGAKYSDQLQWYEKLSAAVSRLTGVELASLDGCSLSLTITQTIPRAMPGREHPQPGTSGCATLPDSQASQPHTSSMDPSSSAAEVAGPGAETAEHVLTLEFEGPGSDQLRSAALNPPAVDIEEDVRVARAAQEMGGPEAAGALSGLLMDVKARLRRHCRRQLQLEDAHEIYPLQPTSVSPTLIRCVLPNKIEVELDVPLGWPEEPGTRLQLVQLQAPRASQDLAPVLARLQQELEEALAAPEPAAGPGQAGGAGAAGGGAGGVQAELRRRQLQGCSLRELLGWVYGNVAAHG